MLLSCGWLDNTCSLNLPSDETDDDGDGFVECTIDNNGWDGDSAIAGGEDCDDSDGNEYQDRSVQRC